MVDLLSNGSFAESVQDLVSSATNYVLNNGSSTITRFTGTIAQTVVLPNASSCFTGQHFIIVNRTTVTITVLYQDLTAFTTISTGSDNELTLLNNGSTNGTWEAIFSGGGETLKDGGIETSVDTTQTSYTVTSGNVNFHPYMTVQSGQTLTVASGARLVTTEDTVIGTVVVQPGGIWKVL